MSKAGAALFTIATLVWGCAAPLQGGGVDVLPGSAERLMLALRMGLAVPGEGMPEVAQARRIVSPELLLEGEAPRGKLGDYLIENRRVRVIVADTDGSPRGGTIVDLAVRGVARDAFDGMTTEVFGRRVRYTTIKDGYDEATASAFVSVTGAPEGLPAVEVQTRYDVAPGLESVVAHTTIKALGEVPEGPVVTDTLASDRARFVTQGDGVGLFGLASASFGVKPLLVDPAGTIASDASGGRARIAVDVSGERPLPLYLFSRLIAPLERPDTLALAAGLAQDEPGSITDLDVGLVAERARAAPFVGAFRVERLDGDRAVLDLVLPRPVFTGERITARVPAGRYRITFAGEGTASKRAQAFAVRPGQNARVDLVIGDASAAPSTSAAPSPDPTPNPTSTASSN